MKLSELAIGTEVSVTGKIVGLDLARYDEDGEFVGIREDGLVAVEVLVRYDREVSA